MDENRLYSELLTRVQALSEGGELAPVADLIANEIRRDAQVCYWLRYRLGYDGMSTVCGWLQSS